MSIKDTANNLVGRAFSFLGSIQTTITYHSVSEDPQYNPDTGTVVRPDDQTIPDIGALIVGLSAEEIAADIGEMSDRKIFIKKDELPVVPKNPDYVTTPDGDLEVKSYRLEPTESLVVLVVRGL